jgi:indolepyruvate ferredoxin oxidoreductase
MGGEGAAWIGQAPFVSSDHVFQNLGDGTYTHSGSLAIRAAVAAHVNITFKILYNDAVAMTGGQPVEGGFTPAQIAQQLVAEGVGRVVIVTDHPGKYASQSDVPAAVNVFGRDELDHIQRQLRDFRGVSALIYDQACAAELRRKRKRGVLPTPQRRVVINEFVCEGCGDCNAQSNCLSVLPLETEFGRKRTIDQSACNRDYTCIRGFCPSFVTLHGATPRQPTLELPRDFPTPRNPPLHGACNILIAGVGGTGVVTLGKLLGLAAHLEGKAVAELAQTGLAQKFGAVLSHVRIAPNAADLNGGGNIADGEANLLLGCDLMVAASAL